MFYTVFLRQFVYLLVILYLTCLCDRTEGSPRITVKRKVNPFSAVAKKLQNKNSEVEKRGFFSHGGLFSIGKVLNFFPVGGERECQPAGYTAARAGICLNPYDCRQRDGRAAGDCAHGLGVCCVFEVTCGGVVQHNLTYFMSPGFPELWSSERTCDLTIEKAHAGIMQLRVDFVHFTIGQPNRTTGACDEDVMILGDAVSNFTVCGQNHGQHIYFNLPTGSETREAGDLPSSKATKLSIRMRGGDMPRLWLLRLAQMPLAHSAPHNCLQYYTSTNVNGRHLASQQYRACVRRDAGACSVRYSPCDARSFRIGPGGGAPAVIDPAETVPAEQLMPGPAEQVQDEVEGSGADPQMATPMESPPAQQSYMAMIWSYIWPSWLWEQRSLWSWSPYAQHFAEDDGFRYYGYGNFGVGLHGFGRQRCTDRITIPCENEYFVGERLQRRVRGGKVCLSAQHFAEDEFRYYGYGNFGVGLHGFGRQRCTDRITIPCENEYFVGSASQYAPGVCDPHHCGGTFCPGLTPDRCRVDTSITPFAVSVHFGPPTVKRSPEDNIGVCLRYSQVPCTS